jgi:hypothetical protein
VRRPTPSRPRRSSRAVSALAVALALLASIGLLLAPASTSSVAAATPDLTVVGNARYVVQPEHRRVHISVGLTATNHKPDTVTTYYYFDRFYLQVLPGTKGFKVSALGVSPSVRVAKSTRDYTLLLISLGRRLRSQKSMQLTLSFDLPDPGGAALRPVRIGNAIVNFPVWAYGTASTPGSTVSVTLPPGFSIDPTTTGFAPPVTNADGTIVLTGEAIANPLTWAAGVVADRPGAYRETSVSTTAGSTPVQLAVRSWTDDMPWNKRVSDLLKRGLPVIARLVGAPYPRTDRLVVQEAVSRSLGGYAGLFDPASGRMEISYDASGFIVLHEASHTWFNGSLLADRWANEAWASYYGALAASQLKVKASIPSVTPALEKARIPLNAWGALGRQDDVTEEYAYAASLAFAQAVAARAGPAALRDLWRAAEDHAATYQPVAAVGAGAAASATEQGSGTLDWRGLLDLVENRTGKSFADLWSTWVVRPDEAALLDTRAQARTDYENTIKAAGAWQLPQAVRQAMEAWQFDTARGLLSQARQVLDQRTEIANAAAAAGLTPPHTLESAFEGDAGLRAAGLEGEAEIAAIKAVSTVGANRPAQLDPLQQLGLLGAHPDADMAAARVAFASGDLSGAVDRAEAARSTWLGAEDIGRTRALSIGAAGLAALILLMVLVATTRRVRRRRARRRMARLAIASALAADSVTPFEPDGGRRYVTLAADQPGISPSDASGGRPAGSAGVDGGNEGP